MFGMLPPWESVATFDIVGISVQLGQADIESAMKLARATYKRFESTEGYYRNTSNSHIVGKIGELAAHRWLNSAHLPVQSLYEDPTQVRSADLEVAGIRIEVKTWNHDYWYNWGRCVAVGQLATLRQKSDCVLWASAKISDTTALVSFHGWSTLPEVETAPVRWTGPTGRKVKNYQLESESLRDVSKLIEALHRKYFEANTDI